MGELDLKDDMTLVRMRKSGIVMARNLILNRQSWYDNGTPRHEMGDVEIKPPLKSSSGGTLGLSEVWQARKTN